MTEVSESEPPPSEAPPSDPPRATKRGKLLVEKLNAYRNIILAVAALATAIGSWFRPTDTTATKNSFDWSSKKIEELSDNEIKMKQDMVALRNYVEGYVRGQAAAAERDRDGIGDTFDAVGGGGHRPKPAARKPPHPHAVELFEEAAPTSEAMAAPDVAMNQAPPLPELQANPIAIKKPSFEKLAEALR